MSAAAENKAETVEAAATDVAARVLKQVEFYFGDSNLPRDRFLLGQTQKTEEGWVSIDKIMSFKRMQEISTDRDVVVAALRSSKELLAVSTDGALVRRATPLPDKTGLDERSIYAKGVPMDSTVDSLLAFFREAVGGRVLSVRMRRTRDKTFKGSVFVELESAEKAAEVAKAGLKAASGEALLVELKGAYIERKKKEAEARRVSRDGAAAAAAPAAAEGGDDAARGTKRKAEGAAEAPAEASPIAKNLLVKLEGVGDEASRESIKEALVAAGVKVAYTDFSRGLKDAVVRLEEGSDAAAVAAKLAEDKVKVGEAEPKFSALAGEEEEEYHNKVREFKRRRSSGGGRGGRGGGRGGRRQGKNRR